MRTLILAAAILVGGLIAPPLRALHCAWLRLRLWRTEADLQIINHQAQRMAADRLALVARRGDLAIALMELDAAREDLA